MTNLKQWDKILSKLKEQFLEALKDEPRVTIQKEPDRFITVFIKGLDECWCCFAEEDDEIRITGEISFKTNYKEIWIESELWKNTAPDEMKDGVRIKPVDWHVYEVNDIIGGRIFETEFLSFEDILDRYGREN